MLFNPRLLACLALLPAVVPSSAAPRDAAALEFFEKKVRPIFVDHCYTCHSAGTKPSGGLRVDDRNGLLSGGNSGPAVVPGKPDESLLLRRVNDANMKKRMPLEGKQLTTEQTADLRRWIEDGAAWPTIAIPASLGKPKPAYEKLRKQHWAWQPLVNPKVPTVGGDWARDDIDRFLLAKLEGANLKPVGDADRVALIRRVSFDLLGLPPTPAEIEVFVKDNSTDAFAKVVDRLLASPAFGERWGRHWLDVARYGESTGPSRNIPYPHAWKYRDYVIDAVNADVPFDRFIREQIAGDLLPTSSTSEKDRLLTATGFLALGVKDVNQRFKVRFVMDNADEQIDAVTRSVLGLTVTCARCHDHKFDPIPTTDYYALAGIFTSTDNCAGVRNKMGGGGLDYYDPAMLVALTERKEPAFPERIATAKREFDEAKKAWDAIRGTPEGLAKAADGFPTQRPFRLKFEKAQADLLALSDPVAAGNAVHGVREAKTIADTEVRIRGEAEKVGPRVPRGFLSAFEVPGTSPVNPRQSGRLELAQWLTSPKNPLAPRVAVNRIWQHLFGQGIVSSVDNFGVTGAPPSHPELLDHLATRFIREGWSVKKLVRILVLSRAYQLAGTTTDAHRAVDPGNRLIGRHLPRRLSAEEFRDAVLATAGTLDRRRATPSPARELKMVEMADNSQEARTLHDKADTGTQRSLYLPLVRGVTPRSLAAFDPVDQTLVTGSRDTTTVPAQALFLLNSPFMRRQSLSFAERLLYDPNLPDSARIDSAYRLALGRSPTESETARARAFIADYELSWKDEPPMNPVDPLRPKTARVAAWQAFGQALMGSAEFRYLN